MHACLLWWQGKEEEMRITDFTTLRRTLWIILMIIAVGLATPTLSNYSDLSAQGWESNRSTGSYDSGVRAGQQDARRNLSNNYLRHRREFTARLEGNFRQGYENGYQNESGRSGYRPFGYRNDNRGDDQLYNYGNGNAEYAYASSAGSMIWRGRVDHYVELRVRGNQVQSIERQGAPTINEAASFTNPLPRADMQVFIGKRAGRGRVELVQQPSRFNGFTAVIAINDESGGADDYEIEMAWR
jgi:hypothetical protein